MSPILTHEAPLGSPPGGGRRIKRDVKAPAHQFLHLGLLLKLGIPCVSRFPLSQGEACPHCPSLEYNTHYFPTHVQAEFPLSKNRVTCILRLSTLPHASRLSWADTDFKGSGAQSLSQAAISLFVQPRFPALCPTNSFPLPPTLI